MPNCNNCFTNCKESKEKKEPVTIPYIVYEAAVDRAEKRTRRWMITSFALIGIVFAIIIGFLIFN